MTTSYEIRDASGRLVAYHVRRDTGDGKQIWWEQPDGSTGLNGTCLEELPLYGADFVSDAGADELAVVCEGEKARDALEGVKIPAVGTVTGAAGTPGPEALEVLRDRRVCLWPDNDDAGRAHMERIGQRLRGVAAEVRIFTWYDAEEAGADAADHHAVKSGHAEAIDRLFTDLEDSPLFEPEPEAEPGTFTAADLMAQELPEPSWIVPDILAEGVAILAGKPKLGKSWMALGLCVAVASGGYALGTKSVEQGGALYLALEDNRRRLQNRLRQTLPDGNPPADLHMALGWPRMDEGGAEKLDDWLSEHPDARIVCIDTLKKIRPRSGGNRTLYELDYEALEPLIPVAAARGVAIVVVHHSREADADDPLDTVSATTGLTGGVGGVLVMKRERGRADCYLYADGRHLENAAELALRWNAELSGWRIVGDAEGYRMSEERREILSVLEEHGEPMTPTEVADALGKSTNTIKLRLWRMSKDGQLENESGRYRIPRNPGNAVTEDGDRDDARYSVTQVTGILDGLTAEQVREVRRLMAQGMSAEMARSEVLADRGEGGA